VGGSTGLYLERLQGLNHRIDADLDAGLAHPWRPSSAPLPGGACLSSVLPMLIDHGE
jgi:hypothetical protein